MPREPIISLGLNPGTRFLGISAVRDGDLKDWRILGFPGRFSPAKLGKIKDAVDQMLRRIRPTVVALKTPHPSRSSRGLDQVVEVVRELCRIYHVHTFRWTVSDMKRRLYPTRSMNKRRLGELLGEIFPVLRSELDAESRNRNPYHMRAIEAVSLAYLGWRELDGRDVKASQSK